LLGIQQGVDELAGGALGDAEQGLTGAGVQLVVGEQGNDQGDQAWLERALSERVLDRFHVAGSERRRPRHREQHVRAGHHRLGT
jgi:hypothetical protein